ncbi:MAG TPA: Sir2 family NAD-dependent protein deacetylase [Beijerinckiaceae bacterium]|mgnify:CR=1 FL=1|nr:Sir2 family NAD-dependent protein deacetylase [Beijerinckiaceae bacterium]
MSADPAAVEDLADRLRGARRCVGFTGAGISTESGIPDFRSPGSPWLSNKPVPFQAFVASEEARREAWRRKFRMDDHYAGAAPSMGHRFLADLVVTGRMPAIITQNIDGLHQAAGVPPEQVIELHGNGTYATCLDCGRRHELVDVRARFETTGAAPRCDACDGLVKSATISFGQSMPEAQMRRARHEAQRCDLFLAMGSSLVVFPAAAFLEVAKRAGATLVIVNREATEFDPLADLVVRGEIGSVVAGVIDRLGSGR